MSINKKKIGLLIDSIQVSKSINDLINQSYEANNYEISTLIINSKQDSKYFNFAKSIFIIKTRGIPRFIKVLSLRIINLVEFKFFAKKKSPNFFEKYNLSNKGLKIIRVNPIISKSGLFYNYSKSDLKKIREENLELIVRGGSGILKGEILSICPNGIISFHHADNNIIRGGPPGFWEVYNRQLKTGFIIQRLKEELDGGDVLFKGFVKTSWSYTLNLINLLEFSNPFLHKVIEDLTSTLPLLIIHKKVPYCFTIYKAPKINHLINYIFKTFSFLSIFYFSKIIGKYRRWGVAYQFTSSWKDVTLLRSKRIPNPKNRFLADPFIIKRNNSYYCFVEDYDLLEKKGSISVYEINKGGSREIGKSLIEDFHLSYPFLFEYENQLYMCPETFHKGEIRLYKCIKFPLEWKFYKTIMRDVNAVDTSIFFKDKRWWLITNISLPNLNEHNNQLHVFFSNSPLSDKWIPHKKNPVIFDPLRARNGGLIIDKDEIYRVYQRHLFNNYGNSFGVAKINILNSKNYSEENIFEVEPYFFNDLEGTHTYNYVDGLIVFDYLKIQKIT